MLTSTYIHIPKVGKSTEHKIWASGITTWNEFIKHHDTVPIPRSKRNVILEGIDESMERLDNRDSEFFANTLPGSEHWRAYRNFSNSIAYVDIETTGLSKSDDHITVIGVYNGDHVKSFVHGINLDDVEDELNKYEFIVTYNGACFDLPFIKKEYPELEFNQLHVDLMYPLRKLGLKGGLKTIEKNLGIARSDDTVEISGFYAVVLWDRYQKGDEGALDLLLKYNREDIVNLETILDTIHPKLVDKTFSDANNTV
ncbi:MAG: ribonuclease H-like domain-containing protein [Methanohalobium sp.]|uniref:ribonuclease H-like domain-containing protein n=1 Tax=Methanohalobium sp. TaxID=2837493 RepID=UPI00397AE8EE